MKRPLVVMAILGGAILTLACQLILDLEEPAGIAKGGAPGASDSGPGGDPCAHARPPPPPEVDDDPRATSQKNYWFAAERISIPVRADAGILAGLDLDRSCTCSPDLHDGAAPCTTPAQQTTFCDFAGGVDDALGALAQQYAVALPQVDLSERVNRDIRDGERTLLVYLAGYNGKANDKDVGIAFVGGTGIYTNLGCDGRVRDAGPPRTLPDAGKPGPQRAPVWDGCDRWTPAPGLVAGEYPNRIATNVVAAYVNDYTLVIEVKEVGLDLFGGSVRAGNATFVAKLFPEGRSFAAEGFIAGRIEFSELVGALGRSVAPNTDASLPLCLSPAWVAVGPAFCGARDTMRSPALDHTNQVCDALTATIGFRAQAVEIADGQFQNPTRGVECPNDSIVTCETP